jgi:ferredoxin-NADP reductase/Na+-translocating ferredoxin:NAD+ oxidoreductase RnfD subunit
MITFIDNLLNRITMYRLVMYYLAVLDVVAAICGALGLLPYSPLAILTTFFFATLVCWATNEAFAKFFNASPNTESVYITAFILALIIPPTLPSDLSGMLFVFWASLIAMGSKYILTIGKKHLFNPAALAVVVTYFAFNENASWWVGGNLPLTAFVVIGGLLVVRKIQRFDLLLTFLASTIVVVSIHSWPQNPLVTIEKILLHTPILFLGTIMLTEPFTTPPTRILRMVYGALVGFLFAPFIHVGSIYSTPQLALVIGNIFAYVISPKVALRLTLQHIEKAGANMYTFIFKPEEKFAFKPGQYLEWTLPHDKTDQRGNRRYFTIASSPTKDTVSLGVKFYEESSTFKKKLLDLQPGDSMGVNQLTGEFTMPKDPSVKLAFIAGGIGITPFKSMTEFLLDTKENTSERRDVALLYSNKTVSEIAYKELFDTAKHEFGFKVVYAITAEAASAGSDSDLYFGAINPELIKQTMPDFKERMFYLSGPRGMVNAFQKTLSEMGVPFHHIKTDFFPGFV